MDWGFAQAKEIKLLTLDIDEVLTGGRLYYSADGELCELIMTSPDSFDQALTPYLERPDLPTPLSRSQHLPQLERLQPR
ncbi:MAG: hypothetical protein V7629_02440 [Motiliproteus sp.]